MEDEKEFSLRDRIALELMAAMVSNSEKTQASSDLRDLTHESVFWSEGAKARLQRLAHNCYMVADMMRKARLATFE